jgi:hypothetical protein
MGHEVLAAQGTDVGILEEHRRLDAFLGMVQASVREMRAEGVALTYGTANAGAGTMTTELLGLKRLAPVPLLVRPLSSTAAALGWGARMLARVLYACDRLRRSHYGVRDAAEAAEKLPAEAGTPTGSAGVPPSGGRSPGLQPPAHTDGLHSANRRFRLSRIARFDERFDRFWQEIRDDYPVMLVRDAAHLNWRYAGAPNAVFERLCIESAAGRIEGYAVLGLRRRDGRLRGCIADLVTARNGDPGIVASLIHAAIAWFHAQAADVAEVWAFPHTHLRRALVCRGFIPRRTGPGGFQVNALASATAANPSVAERAGRWFLSIGDSDTV